MQGEERAGQPTPPREAAAGMDDAGSGRVHARQGGPRDRYTQLTLGAALRGLRSADGRSNRLFGDRAAAPVSGNRRQGRPAGQASRYRRQSQQRQAAMLQAVAAAQLAAVGRVRVL